MKQLVERKQYMQILRYWKDKNVIKVLSGVRRCGKSTILQMFKDDLLQHGITAEQIQFYNFEDLKTLAIGDIYQIHTHIENKLIADKMNYIFLDEIQNVKEFQRLVDSLFIKKNCDVYITGSNAYLLSGELATLLTGRYIETHVFPFSYSEYIDFLTINSEKLPKNETFLELQSPNPQKLQKTETFADFKLRLTKTESFEDFIYYGGMPEAYNLLIDALDKSDIFLKAIKDSNPKYLLTMDRDFDPVYDGIRKLNVVDWMLSGQE